jgi:DNA-binding NtrC family response regulator
MARILLIDDEQVHREFVATALSRKGHAVTAKESAVPVIRDIGRKDFGNDFDVVITDIVMPDVEGIELIRALKAAHPRCRIIAISGAGPRAGSRSYLQMAQHLGAQSTLAKPFTITDLYGAVEQAIAVT